jgi:long-chain acyl-CoA synthetase
MFTMSVALDRAGRHYPHATSMVEEGGATQNWAEHINLVSRLAAGLCSVLPKVGQRFAILAPNSVSQATLIHGGYWSGRVPVPLNYRLSVPELFAILVKSSASILVVAGSYLEAAQQLKAQGWDGEILILGPALQGFRGTDDFFADYEPIAPVQLEASDEAILLFTGGTTGEGKGVALSHNNVVANGFQIAASLSTGPNDRYLHVAPMFHSADLIGTAMTLCGGAHSFLAQPSPTSIIDAIERRGITMSMAPPVLVKGIIQSELTVDRAFEKLRVFICGGAPVPIKLLLSAAQLMPATALVQGYGMTETSPILSFLHLPQARSLGLSDDVLNSSGIPLPGVEMRILDAQGPNDVGELLVRGPNVFSGYLERPELNEISFVDGWFLTGDVARIDSHGFVYILDRIKDVIITGGENVYSSEVESTLLDHPDILEVAVIGVPDEHWGERIAAVFVACPGSSPDKESLSDHCRAQLGGYKVPRLFKQVDSLPKSALGKTLKNSLRELFLDEPKN